MGEVVSCIYCSARNTVATCPTCGHLWVVGHDAGDVAGSECAYDRAMSAGSKMGAVSGGLRQKTCIECNREFVSELDGGI